MLFSIYYGDLECSHDALLEGPPGMTTSEFRSLCESLKPPVLLACRTALRRQDGTVEEYIDLDKIQAAYVRLLTGAYGFKRVDPVRFDLPAGRELRPDERGYGHERWLGPELTSDVLAHNAEVDRGRGAASAAILDSMAEERKAAARREMPEIVKNLVNAAEWLRDRKAQEERAYEEYDRRGVALVNDDDRAKMRSAIAEAVSGRMEAETALRKSVEAYDEARKEWMG